MHKYEAPTCMAWHGTCRVLLEDVIDNLARDGEHYATCSLSFAIGESEPLFGGSMLPYAHTHTTLCAHACSPTSTRLQSSSASCNHSYAATFPETGCGSICSWSLRCLRGGRRARASQRPSSRAGSEPGARSPM